jgi:hypothetical protein
MHMTSDYIYPFWSERVSRCSSTGGQGRDDRKPKNEKMLLVSRSRQLSQKPESIPFSQWRSQTLTGNERHRPDLRLPHFMGAGLRHWSVHVQRARDAARLRGGGEGGSHAYADTRTGTTFTLTKNLLAPNFDTAEHVAHIVTKAVADG